MTVYDSIFMQQYEHDSIFMQQYEHDSIFMQQYAHSFMIVYDSKIIIVNYCQKNLILYYQFNIVKMVLILKNPNLKY
jgi:hypothetical protein